MRLIDADSVTLDMPMYNSFSVVMPLEERFRIMLKRQPTVKAIPIEFIEEYIEYQDTEEKKVLRMMWHAWELWEKENANPSQNRVV